MDYSKESKKKSKKHKSSTYDGDSQVKVKHKKSKKSKRRHKSPHKIISEEQNVSVSPPHFYSDQSCDNTDTVQFIKNESNHYAESNFPPHFYSGQSCDETDTVQFIKNESIDYEESNSPPHFYSGQSCNETNTVQFIKNESNDYIGSNSDEEYNSNDFKSSSNHYPQPTEIRSTQSIAGNSSSTEYSSKYQHPSEIYNSRSRKSDAYDNNSQFTIPKRKAELKCENFKSETDSFSVKKQKADSTSDAIYSNVAKNMMKTMGFEEGTGLGLNKQGRLDPVKESLHRGRRGLGHSFSGSKKSNIKYDPDKEICEVEERVFWLECDDDPNEIDPPDSWTIFGERKLTLDDEIHFCDSHILKNILTAKSVFDDMSSVDKEKARNRANPFEMIKNCMFMNRAALKMANMDVVFDRMFTNPVFMDGEPMANENQLLYFADVCAGPGGFSEFILSRKKWRAKGFGFTLKDDHDFKLEKFYAGTPETFEPLYGEYDDGDIFKLENIVSLSNYIHENTDGQGVHFMMADGGFSVEGNENIQEILSKQLYLCQCLAALMVIREHGHFVCKLFDIFTPFSAGIIYLMYQCFHKISIHKPNTSRPANSERYLICKWKKGNVNSIRDYMFRINSRLCNLKEGRSEEDVTEIVPLYLMKNDIKFYSYLVDSNNRIGEQQVNSLAKFCAYLEDEKLVEPRQKTLKDECLKYWGITSDVRSEPCKDNARSLYVKIMDNDLAFLKGVQPREIKEIEDLKQLFPIYDWHVALSGSKGVPKFYLGLGGKRVYEWNNDRWLSVDQENINLELSPGTLLYAKIVQEYAGERQGQSHVKALHIIDAYTLGDMEIGFLHYTKRLEMCQLYCKALAKPSITNMTPLRVKPIFNLVSIQKAFLKLQETQMKNNKIEMTYRLNEEKYFVPKGLIFIKATEPPWARHISMSSNCTYYAAKDRESVYDKDRPADAIASFKSSCRNGLIWNSPNETNLYCGVPIHHDSLICFLSEFVDKNRFTKNVVLHPRAL